MNTSEEAHRLTETIYRNLSEQFSPAVKQLVTCAKVYHKALVGLSSAARAYIESVGRLGHNCKTSSQGGAEEIGQAIFRIAEIQKEMQLKFEDCNKSLFAEIILPLEQKLENEFKNAGAEQKKYHSGHKTYIGPYTKAADSLKKFRKKSKASRMNFADDKEISLLRNMERCQDKLDEFRLQGLKLALLQERKCYCFVLSRLSSLSSTQLHYHDRGMDLISGELGSWRQLCSQPNILPHTADHLFRVEGRQSPVMNGSTVAYSVYSPESIESNHTPNHHPSSLSGLTSDFQRSTQTPEYALPASEHSVSRSISMSMSLPPSGPAPAPPSGPQVRAMYNHMAEQPSQLPFTTGDLITLMGQQTEGWQFGQNPRNGLYGWFPLSFTQPLNMQPLRLQTQTPMRFQHQRAKSIGDMHLDDRSLSDMSFFSDEHNHLPGTSRRPRSLHESSLMSAPNISQAQHYVFQRHFEEDENERPLGANY